MLRDGLAVAGETGTLAERWRGTPVAGRLRAKTGSLRNVTALAGEIEPLAGGMVTFAYVANVPDPGLLDPGDVDMNGLADILVPTPATSTWRRWTPSEGVSPSSCRRGRGGRRGV